MRKTTEKYDDVKWHTGGDFPPDLNADAARTHMGMFIAWAAENNLLSEMLKRIYPEQVSLLTAQKIRGSAFIRQCCDDKLTTDDFSDVGNAFAKVYYEYKYMDDYAELSSDSLPTIYHEPDSLEKYYKIKEILSKRFFTWQAE